MSITDMLCVYSTGCPAITAQGKLKYFKWETLDNSGEVAKKRVLNAGQTFQGGI